MTDSLSNRSRSKNEPQLPTRSEAAFLTDKIGLMSTKQQTLNFVTMWVAGPLPIDLPTTTTSLTFTCRPFTKKLRSVSASDKMSLPQALYLCRFRNRGTRAPRRWPGQTDVTSSTMAKNSHMRLQRKRSSALAWKYSTNLFEGVGASMNRLGNP